MRYRGRRDSLLNHSPTTEDEADWNSMIRRANEEIDAEAADYKAGRRQCMHVWCGAECVCKGEPDPVRDLVDSGG